MKHKIYHTIHKPTGAIIPVIIEKTSKEGIVEKYREYTKDRKGFTLDMLEIRWDKTRQEVIYILQKYQVPGHINHSKIANNSNLLTPADIAIFFEEYIIAIEKKEKMQHNKLKAKSLEKFNE